MRIESVASLYRLNTRLFLNCLDGVSDERAVERPNGSTNSLAFVACHLLDSRHFLERYMGLAEANPVEELLREVTRIEDVTDFPPLDVVRLGWRSLAPTLERCVAELSTDELRAPSPQRFPVDLPTIEGGIAFLAQHESYHIGQMALLRKYLGYDAMRYGA